MNSRSSDVIVLWEAPPPGPKTEFRLYYDANGKVRFYTCEKPDGEYIVIDSQTFAEGRPDVRVVNGRISTVQRGHVVARLTPGGGTKCVAGDISIIAGSYAGPTTNWEIKVHEL